MKKKKIEMLSPKQTNFSGMVATVQMLDSTIIINVFKNKLFLGKYCIDQNTYEYAQYSEKEKKWTRKKLFNLMGLQPPYYWNNDKDKKLKFDSKEDQELVNRLLEMEKAYCQETTDLINRREEEYNRKRKRKTEKNRLERVEKEMAKVPELPAGLEDWIMQKEAKGVGYAFFNKESEKWTCTECEKTYTGKYLKREDGEKKVRHNDKVICPKCGKLIQAKKRTKKQEITTHFSLMQPIDDEVSTVRYFDVKILWDKSGRHIEMQESIRLMLCKTGKCACDIYYRNWGYFDNKGNPTGRRTYTGYLYEYGIEETLKGTVYEDWARLFTQMAAAGQKLQYNRMMATQRDKNTIDTFECLFKGRFYRLLRESTEGISYWKASYTGILNIEGKTIEEVFGINDKQKINRIREIDGGRNIVRWMRWSDKTGNKIPQDVLQWLTDNEIEQNEIKFIEDKMSIMQIMNYVKKQQKGEYKGRTAKDVLSQWEDYISMCKNLKKNIDDEMVYKPRQLKRRHDEAVEETNKRRMLEEMKRSKKRSKEEAERMRKKFPGAEENLREVKQKYEYQNSEYKIIVPTRLLDIVAEGHALHHCVGSSDRYFDRIMQHETYVCFLRKRSEPEVPYYTIEFEPCGTIRQHRTFYDEETNIKEIRKFLKEWQQEIKKRMKEEDRERAKISKQKRIENIEDLKQKNNTKVLNALMEDFMEAM